MSLNSSTVSSSSIDDTFHLHRQSIKTHRLKSNPPPQSKSINPSIVLISKSDQAFPERTIKPHPSGLPIIIGRATTTDKSNKSKNPLASSALAGPDNAKFHCSVISRTHAQITWVNNQPYLQDTGSTHGTWYQRPHSALTNQPGQPQNGNHSNWEMIPKSLQLQDGMSIRFGRPITNPSTRSRHTALEVTVRIPQSTPQTLKPGSYGLKVSHLISSDEEEQSAKTSGEGFDVSNDSIHDVSRSDSDLQDQSGVSESLPINTSEDRIDMIDSARDYNDTTVGTRVNRKVNDQTSSYNSSKGLAGCPDTRPSQGSAKLLAGQENQITSHKRAGFHNDNADDNSDAEAERAGTVNEGGSDIEAAHVENIDNSTMAEDASHNMTENSHQVEEKSVNITDESGDIEERPDSFEINDEIEEEDNEDLDEVSRSAHAEEQSDQDISQDNVSVIEEAVSISDEEGKGSFQPSPLTSTPGVGPSRAKVYKDVSVVTTITSMTKFTEPLNRLPEALANNVQAPTKIKRIRQPLEQESSDRPAIKGNVVNKDSQEQSSQDAVAKSSSMKRKRPDEFDEDDEPSDETCKGVKELSQSTPESLCCRCSTEAPKTKKQKFGSKIVSAAQSLAIFALGGVATVAGILAFENIAE